MSNTPISASRPAAVVTGMPWSCAAGMKWVAISPFVDQPQMKNVADQYPEGAGAGLDAQRADASRRRCAPRCRRGLERRPRLRRAPYAVVPTSDGLVRRSSSTSGTSSAAPRHDQSGRAPARARREVRDQRQEDELTGGGGRPENTPVTSPRCRTNHRFATIAPEAPAPSSRCPARRPPPTAATSCQGAVITMVSPLPSATPARAHGHHPADAEALHQRGGERRGEAEHDEVERHRARGRRATSRTRPPAARSARRWSTGTPPRRSARPKVTRATNQARWMRARGAAPIFTPPSSLGAARPASDPPPRHPANPDEMARPAQHAATPGLGRHGPTTPRDQTEPVGHRREAAASAGAASAGAPGCQ